MLLDRKYPVRMIDSAMNKVRKVTRNLALKLLAKPTSTMRPVFVLTWDLGLPSIQAVTHTHWRTMTMVDPQLQEAYPEPPLIAYKRLKNIKDFLIGAKVPPPLNKNPKQIIPGMEQCTYNGQQWHACPYVKETKEIKLN